MEIVKKKRSAETILDIISELWERPAIAAAAKLAALDLRDCYDGAAHHAYRKAILAMMRDKGGGRRAPVMPERGTRPRPSGKTRPEIVADQKLIRAPKTTLCAS